MGNTLRKKRIDRSIRNDTLDLSKLDPDIIPSLPWLNSYIDVYVYKVIDGDTVKILLLHDRSLFKFSIRIEGIDTPEIRGCSDLEKEAGLLVKEFLKKFIEKKIVTLYTTGNDKYGGRLIGSIFTKEEKLDIAEILLYKGYAKRYSGRVKKDPWTDEQLQRILKKNENLIKL